MKKILLMMMVGILAFGSLTFASDVDEVNLSEIEARHDENLQRMTHIFETYYPEMLDTYLSLDAEHMAFHDAQRSERQALIEAGKATFNDIRKAVQDGEMTREEGKAALDAIREEHSTTRSEIQAVLELKKAELEASKADNEAVRESLKTLLSAEVKDEAAIQAALDQAMTLLEHHIAIDEKYAALIDEIVL